MRKNKLKAHLAAGRVILNGWLHIPNTWSAEVMAHAGWDAVTVDLQHGLHGMETAIQLMQIIGGTEAVPVARASWNDPSAIMRLLDGGAYGIICPMIEDGEACRRFVGACRYPPEGYRSFGPTRARVYGGSDYGMYANEEMLTMAMVETQKGVDHLDEICSAPGLDGIFVGSGDLRLSLTGSTQKPEDDTHFEEAIAKILKACREHRRIAGIWCATPQAAKTMRAKGFQWIAVQSDSMMLSKCATDLVKDLKNDC